MLPPGSIKLEAVWIDGERYTDFDADALTVNLPAVEAAAAAAHPLEVRPAWAGNPRLLPPTAKQELQVRVRIVPAGLPFDMALTMQGGEAVLDLEGDFAAAALLPFRLELDKVVAAQPSRVVIRAEHLQALGDACGRALAFVERKLGVDSEIVVVGANTAVKETLTEVGLENVRLIDRFEDALQPA